MMILKTHFEKHGKTIFHETFIYVLPKLWKLEPFEVSPEFSFYRISSDSSYLAIEMSTSKNKKNHFCRSTLINMRRNITENERSFVKTKCDEYFNKNPYIMYNIRPLTQFT